MAITKRHRDKDLPSQKEWQERTRQKIRDSKIVEKGIKVLDGELKLDNGQLQVLKMLLPTILPTQSESSVENITPEVPDLKTLGETLRNSPEVLDALGLMLKPETKPFTVTKDMQETQAIKLDS
jgi:hypothetical protein